MKIWRCGECPAPARYQPTGDEVQQHACDQCGGACELARYVSFVDNPGHEQLIATMLNGASVMDGALFIVAADHDCPQVQTEEHLIAAEVLGVKKYIMVQTKVDLVKPDRARQHKQQIEKFIAETSAEGSTIVPICSQHRLNIDLIAQYIVEQIPQPVFDLEAPLRMLTVRSFDVNRPGTVPAEISGGVIGGSIQHGRLDLGERIEIRPGIVRVGEDGTITVKPILTRVIRIKSNENILASAHAGGLIALETTVDPCLTRSDRMVGAVIGRPGQMPDVYQQLTVKCMLLRKLAGEDVKIKKLLKGEQIQINASSAQSKAMITATNGDTVVLNLTSPVCVDMGAHISISRRVNNRWRLVGVGEVKNGVTMSIV